MRSRECPENTAQASDNHLLSTNNIQTSLFSSTLLQWRHILVINPRSLRAVAVIGNYGNRNLGDEATLAALIHQIQLHCPHATVYCLSVDPEDTRIRHTVLAVPSFPITRQPPSNHEQLSDSRSSSKTHQVAILSRHRLVCLLKANYPLFILIRTLRHLFRKTIGIPRAVFHEVPFLIQSLKTLRKADLLIIGGGGQLTDQFGGVWGRPFLLFKWLLISKVAGIRLIIVSTGAGPLHSFLSRLIVRTIVTHAEFRSFRDQGSIHLMKLIGIQGISYHYPDLAYALPQKNFSPLPRGHEHQRIVGINPFPYHDSRYVSEGDYALYRAYLTTLSAFMSWLIQNNYRVLLFPTQLRADTLVIRDLMDLLAQTQAPVIDKTVFCPSISTVDDLIACISTTDLVVASRFHGILLSFLAGKPVLALSNHPKMEALMTEMRQSEYVLSLRNIGLDSLILQFTRLEANADSIRTQVQERTHEYRLAVDRQFDLLFGPRNLSLIPGAPVIA